MDAYRKILLEILHLEQIADQIVEAVPLPIRLAATPPELLQSRVDILPSVARDVVAHVRGSLDRIYQFGAAQIWNAESPMGESQAVHFISDGERIQTAVTREDAGLLLQAYASRSSALVLLAEKIERAGTEVCNALRQQRDTDASVAWIGMQVDLAHLRESLTLLSV